MKWEGGGTSRKCHSFVCRPNKGFSPDECLAHCASYCTSLRALTDQHAGAGKPEPKPKPRFFLQNRTETDRKLKIQNRNNTTPGYAIVCNNEFQIDYNITITLKLDFRQQVDWLYNHTKLCMDQNLSNLDLKLLTDRLSRYYTIRQTIPYRYNSMWKIMSPQFILRSVRH